jgi:hypothetical protein
VQLVGVLMALRGLNSAGKRWSVLIGQMMTPTTTGKPVALVIGNSVYQNLPAIENTVNDAHAISTTFALIGYTVIKRTNERK